MKVITRARRSGKTYKMMKLFIEDPSSYVIVISENEKNRLIKEYKLSIDQSKRILPWEAAKEKTAGLRHASIFVDNADVILMTTLGFQIDVISITGVLI